MAAKVDLEGVRAAVGASLERIEAHPFVVGANARTLTRAQAERWIMCAGRESRSFPAILDAMLKRVTQPRVREVLESNLRDELGNGRAEDAHFQHYLHLLDSMAIPHDAFFRYAEGPGIEFALRLAHSVASQSSEGLALGYMLINEGMTPAIYSAAHRALAPYHPELNQRFFELHVEVDVRHVDELYQAIGALRSDTLSDVIFGVAVGERGMAALLDEVYGVFDSAFPGRSLPQSMNFPVSAPTVESSP